jgi:hypothetical protein
VVGGGEVVEEDAPGDAVDDQVMGGEQQVVVGVRAGVVVGGGEQWPGAEVEGALVLPGVLLDLVEPIDPGRGDRRLAGVAVCLVPSMPGAGVGQPQGVVVLEQAVDRLAEGVRVEGSPIRQLSEPRRGCR